MANLFKTDGIRGISQIDITPSLFQKIGIYLALNSSLPIGIGYDTRESSVLYKDILSSTINSYGKDVLNFGIITTPGLNYLAKENKCSYGVMITASHNPYEYNGIKIFDQYGKKINTSLQEEISEFINNGQYPKYYPQKIGKTFSRQNDIEKYQNYLITNFKFSKILNKEILIDPSNGSGSYIFKEILIKLGFKNITSINNIPDGKNINKDCGSTHIDKLIDKKSDILLTLDGDGDRFVGYYKKKIIDGGILSYLLTNINKEEYKDGIVSTFMTNRSIIQNFHKLGIPYYESEVGDSNVLELMEKYHCSFGFEPSGHLLFDNYSDGIYSAIVFLTLLESHENEVNKLLNKIHLNHQKILNYPLKEADKFIFNITHDEIYSELKRTIKPLGRIKFRKSGTEDLFRILLESRSKMAIKKVQSKIEKYMEDNKCAE